MSSVTFDILARDRASQAFKNVGKETDNLHGKFTKLGGAATTLAKGALIGGVGAAVGGLAVVLKTGISEVSDYQRGFAQLSQGLKTTHGVAGITAKQMEALASNIQGYSGQTDDSIVATEQLLLTFTNIRNEAGKNNDVFTQTTKIAADMAARMGGDASTQAIRLGKALNDPVKGVSALQRVGVSFDAGQKKQIKTLVAHGKTLQAQKIILRELNKEFGGSAKAVGNTLPGMIDKAKRHFEDWSQSLVTKMLPGLTSFAHFVGDKIIPVVEQLAGQGFARLMPAMQAVSQVITQHLVPAFEAVASFVQTNILPVLRAVAQFVIDKLYPAIARVLGGALDGLRAAFQHISATVAAHREQLRTLGTFIRKVAEIALKVLAPVLSVALKTAFRILGTAISVTITIIAGAVSAIRGIIHVGQAVVGWVRSNWQLLATLLAGPFAVAVRAIHGHLGDMISFVRSIPGRVKAIFSGAASWLLDAGRQVIAGFISGLKSMAGDIIGAIKSTITDRLPGFVKKALGIASPSKVFAAIGLNVMQGLVSGLSKGQAPLKAALQTLIGQFRDTAQSVAGGLASFGDISGAGDAGVGIPAFLRARANSMQRFARLFHQLAARGLSPALLQQFAAIGPSATPAMQELLSARGAIRSANAQERRLNRFSAQVGRDVASVQLAHSVDNLPTKIAQALAHELHNQNIILKADGREIARVVRKGNNQNARRGGS